MIKLNLTYVDRKEKTSKRNNKSYVSLSIKATQYGDKFLSGFGNKANESWKVGDEVEVLEVKEVEKEGKVYLNFEMPKAFNGNAELQKALEEIRGQLTKVLLGQRELFEAITNPPKPYPNLEKETGLKEGDTHPFDDDLGPIDESQM